MILPVEYLKSFLAVADSGSFTKAASVIHRTQSAVSMQMRRLEEEIGRPLFARTGKSFTLTVTGETLLEHARRIVKHHDDTVAVFSRPNLYGKIRFGAAEDYASLVLPRILSNFALSYPAIRVDVHVAPSSELKTGLDAGALDIVLCTEIKGNGRVVHREPVVWTASPHHATHEQKPVPIAVYHDGCVFRKWATEALTNQKRAYRIAYVSTSVTGIIAAVQSGLAIAPVGMSYFPAGLRRLGPESGFPLLPTADVWLHKSPTADSEPAACFEQHVISSFSRLNTS